MKFILSKLDHKGHLSSLDEIWINYNIQSAAHAILHHWLLGLIFRHGCND
jgi:hypothetical protein